MPYYHKEEVEGKIRRRTPPSIRQAAREIGMSYSALAKILRGETSKPSQHTSLAIQRWLYPETTFPACTCLRCQELEASLRDRVGILEANVMELMERVDTLEKTSVSHFSISPFSSGGI